MFIFLAMNLFRALLAFPSRGGANTRTFTASPCNPSIPSLEARGRRRTLKVIAVSSILSETIGKLDQGPNEEEFQEVDGKDHNEGGKIDPHPPDGEKPAHFPKRRFCGPVEKPNDGVVGIRAHPRDEGPDDDDPHIDGKADVDYRGQGQDEIAHHKHKTSLSQHDED